MLPERCFPCDIKVTRKVSSTSVEAIPRELLICQTEDGKEPFTDWFFDKLDAVSRARVRAKLDRLEDAR